jgi:hypothetical protein
MAKTSYVEVVPELEDQFFLGIRSADRFVHARLVRKPLLFSVKKKKGISQRSLLPQISEIWNSFSDEQKQAWNDAGAVMGLSGFKLFVQDQVARIKQGLSGTATPSLLHQSWVGCIHIEAPADEIKLVQIHPRFYWVQRKVKGTKNMYEPVLVQEFFGFPVKIGLNYYATLEEVSSPSFAKFFIRFWHSYQGEDKFSEFSIPLDYVSDWKHSELTIDGVIGYFIRYDLYFHLKGLRGDLYFDNIIVEHTGQNWARDPFCNNVNQTFTRGFYQIPKHWAPVIFPEGAWYDSIYKDF